MTKIDQEQFVRLDLNNPVFQLNLLTLQKPERHSALDTLNKLRQMTWSQVYRDNAYREGDFIRLLTIASDHDATYGKK